MTAGDGNAADNSREPEATAEPVYEPKPPLWRPARERRRSTLAIVLSAAGMIALGAATSTLLLESEFLSGPATAMPVTIMAIESMSHADADTPGYLIYRVRLPDGSNARFSSQRAHRPGTRLLAMVSRGRLTGRTIVGSPYTVLPDE